MCLYVYVYIYTYTYTYMLGVRRQAGVVTHKGKTRTNSAVCRSLLYYRANDLSAHKFTLCLTDYPVYPGTHEIKHRKHQDKL